MTTSINTNVGALVALQNLQQTNKDLVTVQNRVNTGLRVSSAKDDGAVFAIAQNQRAEVSSFEAVKQSLNRGISTADVALAAGQAISDILVQLKGKALAASETNLDTNDPNAFAALAADYASLKTQITTIIANASFNGVNLIDASGTDFTALANTSGGSITVNGQDLAASITSAATIATSAAAATAVTALTADISAVNSALASLGTESKSLENHATFVGKIQDALKTGIGNLVDADLAAESARLQALQVKQQLGVQALSIANQAPQVLLGLFR